jgi:membrane associated rhomboid family serine protease
MRLTPAVTALLWALAIGFAVQNFAPEPLVRMLMLWPLGEFSGMDDNGEIVSVGFMPWQLLTYGFLHGDFGHLFFNGLALFMFGGPIEEVWGRKRFLTYFLICVAGAGALQLALVSSGVLGDGGPFPTLGASGGVYGLLLAYAMLFPHQRVMLLIPPIPMKARTLAIVFGVIALVSGLMSSGSGIAHFAHLGGMLFGWLVIRYWRGQPPFRPRGPRRPNLRSVN